LVSTSKPIPTNDDDCQPPHRQAANYYKDRAQAIAGEHRVTMEFPSVSTPEEMVFEITSSGATLRKLSLVGGAAVVSAPARRAGGRR
jgi:hypothetical protein